MRNRRFRFEMASSAKSGQIVRRIGGVRYQKFSPRGDVVNVQGALCAWADPAQSAHLVAVQYCQTDSLPMCAKCKASPTAPIRMRDPCRRFLGTCVGAIAAPPLNLAREGSIGVPAVAADIFDGRDESRVAASPGAMTNRAGGWRKRYTTNGAINHRPSGIARRPMTGWRTKPLRRLRFHFVCRPVEYPVAVPTFEAWTRDHRGRMTWFPAKDGRSSSCAEWVLALGAILDDH